jgi:hypothetical protein
MVSKFKWPGVRQVQAIGSDFAEVGYRLTGHATFICGETCETLTSTSSSPPALATPLGRASSRARSLSEAA